jgi:hypothetical protein
MYTQYTAIYSQLLVSRFSEAVSKSKTTKPRRRFVVMGTAAAINTTQTKLN